MFNHYAFLDLTPAPPVGFNVTFMCVEGKVFSHDWFAVPFILMTCQAIISSKIQFVFKINLLG